MEHARLKCPAKGAEDKTRTTLPPQVTIIRIENFPGGDKPVGIWVGQTFELVKGRVVFGRAPENDIPLFSLGVTAGP